MKPISDWPFSTCLRGIQSPITDTKIFYAYSLEDLDSKVYSFRCKIIQMIVSQCNHVKSCKTNKGYKAAFAASQIPNYE